MARIQSSLLRKFPSLVALRRYSNPQPEILMNRPHLNKYVAFALIRRLKHEKDLSQCLNDLKGAVDGTYISSGQIVQHFCDKLETSPTPPGPDVFNCVMASYLIEKNERDSDWRQILIGYGAQIPATTFNQLQGNYQNHLERIFRIFEKKGVFKNSTNVLVQRFLDFATNYGIQTKDPPPHPEISSTIPPNDGTEEKNDESSQPEPEIPKTFLSDLILVLDTNRDLFLRHLESDPRMMFVCGTGVSSSIAQGSKHSSHVTWHGLLDAMRKMFIGIFGGQELPPELELENWDISPVEKSRALNDFLHTQDIDYRAYILHLLSLVLPNEDNLIGNHNSIAAALSGFGLMIATTNYDTLLEICLNRFPHDCTRSPDVLLYSRYIYHLHGLLHEATNIVLEEANDTLSAFLGRMKNLNGDNADEPESRRRLIFIGCMEGVLEHHFSTYLRKEPIQSNFILLKRPDLEKMSTKPLFCELVSAGILVPVEYGKTNDELVPYLFKLLFLLGRLDLPVPPSHPHYSVLVNSRVSIHHDGYQKQTILSSPLA